MSETINTPAALVTCPACKGEGRIERPYIAGVVNVIHACWVCGGRGAVEPERAKKGETA